MTRHRLLALSLLVVGLLAGCEASSPDDAAASGWLHLSRVHFEIASAALIRYSPEPGRPEEGWGALVTDAADACGLVDDSMLSLPPDRSYLLVQVLGDPSQGCPITSAPAPGCQAWVRIFRWFASAQSYSLTAQSGNVRAVFRSDGAAEWRVEAAFRRDALAHGGCERTIGPDGEDEGVWTCVAGDGEVSECEGACYVPSDEICCHAGRTETENLSVTFVTPSCDGSGGGGSGGADGDPP